MTKCNKTNGVNNSLTKCDFGEKISIIDYNSVEKLFICPSDGYIILECNANLSNQSVLWTNGGIALGIARGNGQLNGFSTVNVKKGMKVYCNGLNAFAYFIPII